MAAWLLISWLALHISVALIQADCSFVIWATAEESLLMRFS